MKLDFITNNRQLVFGVDDALVAAGVSALAAGGQAYAQGKMNRKSIKFAREMYNTQRQDAIENFNMVNQYNSPAQQMARLKEAGLNPHLIYGGSGNVTDAAPVSMADVSRPEMKAPDVGNILTSSVNTYLETRQFKAQQRLLDAQTLKLLSETDNKNFDLQQKQRLADTQASILNEINTGKALDNWIKGHQELRNQEAHEANMEKLDKETVKLVQDIAYNTQNHEYDLLKRAQDLTKGAQEIVNLRVDELNKRLEAKLKNGEITRQQYEKETNKLDQMIKYAQSLRLSDNKKFDNANDALQWVNSLFNIGTTVIEKSFKRR